jgi:hypothetical protein
MGQLKNYSSEDVSVIVAGINAEGRSDDFLTVAMAEDAWVYSSGADGEGTYSYNPNRSGTFVITIKQTSLLNAYLTSLLQADITAKGRASFPVLVKNNLGNDLFSADKCKVMKFADAGFGKEAGDREWTIHAHELIMVNGGTFSI